MIGIFCSCRIYTDKRVARSLCDSRATCKNGSHPPSWIFKHLIFWTADKLCRTNMCHHAKFHQNRPNSFGDMWFLDFQDDLCQPSWILKSLIFWTTGKLWMTNMCHHAKFHQNRPNGYGDIVIYTARRYAKRGICRRRVSVCVCVSGCHTLVLCKNG